MPMRPGTTTDDYREALQGLGEFGSLGYEWSDKPHRLVYDLCGEVDHLHAILAQHGIVVPSPEPTDRQAVTAVVSDRINSSD